MSELDKKPAGSASLEEAAQRTAPAITHTLRNALGWGFAGQGFSSLTNFGLSVLAGRALGPKGLGVVFIGFSAYQLLLNLQRALVVQPLIAHAAPLGKEERNKLARSGLTIILLSSFFACGGMLLASTLVGGAVGRGLWLFAPWLPVSLLHEFWKALLFQEGRSRSGAATDALRFAVMCLGYSAATAWNFDYVIVGVWGVAAAAGWFAGVCSMHVRPAQARDAMTWIRRRAWGLGRWLVAREAVLQIGVYATVLALAFVIGSKNLGGLRSAEALFSPFSLIAAALVLPALPALSRALAVSRQNALRLAVRISGVGTILALVYLLVMSLLGRWLFTHLFGSSFAQFQTLIWPVATAQVASASAVAFTVLLTAERRGRELLVTGLVAAVTLPAFEVGLSSVYGVQGAAWGLFLTSVVSSATLIALGSAPAMRVRIFRA